MKIRINTKTLDAALIDVAPFATKSPVPILKYAKITTKGNRMKIEANNTRSSIVRYLDAIEIDQDGKFLVDCTELASFINKCCGNEVELTIEGETMTIKHSKGKASFQVLDTEQFADLDIRATNAVEFTMPSAMLCDCIVSANGFVSHDEFKPVMKPIFAFVKDGEFGYCATDTRKLITAHDKIDNVVGIDVHWFIEPFAFPFITKACKGVDSVTVKVAPKSVSYRIGSSIIETTLTEGKYPDFGRVIPKEWSIECAVDKAEIIDSLNRAALSCEDSRFVKFDISQMDVNISSDNMVKQRTTVENIQHNGCNGAIMLGLHIDNMLTCLRACTSDEVILRMTNPSRPLIIHQASKPNVVILAMPMSIING